MVWVGVALFMSLSDEPFRVAAVELPKPMLAAAQKFIKGLDPKASQLALMKFEDEERMNWNYVPLARKGLPYALMTPAQQTDASELLKASLSASGYKTIEGIRSLENVLRDIENGNPGRDYTRYYFSIFGEPSAKGAWGWRFEGHHISLQWTLANGKLLATTPQFLGTNPAEVRSGLLKGTRILGVEEDLARELVTGLTADQLKTALLSETAPPEILTGNKRKVAIESRQGLPVSQMTAAQRGLLMTLVEEHASIQLPSVARARLQALRKSPFDQVVFAWMGGRKRGEGHYYRIQGPSFLIEYDNTQNDANHVHAVWRDFNGDFGLDLLQQHLQTHRHPH
ncbi:MAG: DUF3500 domain-containing protein [Fimbriimonas sp.]